jgi:hypothetical protein
MKTATDSPRNAEVTPAYLTPIEATIWQQRRERRSMTETLIYVVTIEGETLWCTSEEWLAVREECGL